MTGVEPPVDAAARDGPVADGRRPPILGFGLNAFDGYWQTRQHILSRLARRGWPVGYTTAAMSRWERNGLRWRNAGWRSEEVSSYGVHVRYPGRFPFLLHRWGAADRAMMRRHARVFAASMGRRANGLPIAYVFHPAFWPYVEALECKVVYHADDRFTAMPGSKPEIDGYQRALSERADLIFAITRGIADGLGDRALGKTVIVPNGADADAYESASRAGPPPFPPGIPSPRIAYAGSLNEKIDFALLVRLARARPRVQWLLIGAIHSEGGMTPQTRRRLAECRTLPNVHFLGVKDYGELPAYCAHVDANAMLYRTDGDGWWRYIYPLKLHECLATGRPLLSTDVPALREFADVVAICRSDAEWLDAVDAVVSGRDAGSREARIAVAKANSWEVRVDRIEAHLDKLAGAASALLGERALWCREGKSNPHGVTTGGF